MIFGFTLGYHHYRRISTDHNILGFIAYRSVKGRALKVNEARPRTESRGGGRGGQGVADDDQRVAVASNHRHSI